jgi:hypothetical protein
VTALRTLFALALALTVGSGCSPRDRSNPLDPRNQTTHGGPTGFNAIAGDGVVSLRWPLLTQEGVQSYRIDRWTPGGRPLPLPGAVYPPHVSAAEDLTARNDTTYLYRLVVILESGGTAESPPDTVTPGTRRPMVLVAELPGVLGLSSDARDILFENQASESYDHLDLDSTRGIFWMSQYDRGRILGRTFEGTGTVVEFFLDHPTDLAISTRHAIVWAAQPDRRRVARFGTVDSIRTPIAGVGPARVVESNSDNSTLWIGADDGGVFYASSATADTIQSWRFDARVNVIAVDVAANVAWVATRTGDLCDLYRVTPGSAAVERVRTGLLNVADMEVEPVTHTLWVSERGAPLTGNGRLSRLGPAGEVLTTVTGLEPYALAVEPGSIACWVTDIKSDRLIEVGENGAILRRSPPLGVPYGVRVYHP